MGIMSFIKDAGEKLLGKKAAAATPNPAAPTDADAVKSILEYVDLMGLTAEGLSVEASLAEAKVTVAGVAPDQTTREKIVLCCGNVSGIETVIDNLTLASAQTSADPESRYHTVAKGETLWAIAEKMYGKGNGGEYNRIFEANTPMLKHPDKIYPGQVLRIP